jgi:predicted AAA+ superfamily ATPase
MPTTTNRERIQRGLDLVRDGLGPYLCQTLKAQYKESWWAQGVYYALPHDKSKSLPKQGDEQDFEESLDLASMMTIMERNWSEVFQARLPKQARNYLFITRDTRNSWAHYTGGDLERNDAIFALEAMTRLLTSIESPVADKIDKLAQAVGQTPPPPPPIPESAAPPLAAVKPKKEPSAQRTLALASKPWRDVILPNRDVQEGRLLEAEFVVNLADVLAGKAEFGYQEPVGFFERTYLTSGLRDLLTTSIRRLGGGGGEPVIQLKTAFGGGKTHTMLALYHLVRAGAEGIRLPGMQPLFAAAGVAADDVAGAQVAVLVGTALDATREHLDATGYGIPVRTLWGELAVQLAGAEGYALVEAADKAGRSPGSDTLVELLDQSGPTLILIDELVAYARNLVGREDLPGGTFDAVLTFVQALTEAAKRSPRTLVVASIPESNIEFGNEAGKRAFDALEHTFGRMEAIWKPVAPDEGFEIVRRRLFSEIVDAEAREATCREFVRLYNDGGSGDFPPESASAGYLDELTRCYPIHPEVFYQLYTNWSTLERFQRTRGVLRLMALVIHALWERGDQSKLIMPGDIPLDDRDTRNELLRYLPPTWEAVVDKDVDGAAAEPVKIDKSNARFGQHRAARRVARTVFLASAPHVSQQGVRGVDEARVRLGVVEPGVPIANYNDALRQLGDRLTYLYTGAGLYWYDTHPNLNRSADERAA